MSAPEIIRAVRNRALGAALRTAKELEPESDERRSWAGRLLSGKEKGTAGDALGTEAMLAVPLATALEVVRRQGERIEELERRIADLEKGDEAA